ncbi:MAG: hypothetical protein J6U96_04020, partial [Elusimicrobiaceae bacterium]|nr:hypothetical protein [Elusimicrobiaceae bacterium]
LIELLVVILIIGILAAIALPQYQKAVEKSKASQALTLLRSAYQGAVAYYMANGDYPNSFADMGFEIPWTGNEKWITSDGVKETRSNGEWSIQLYHSATGNLSLYIGRLSGKYRGAGFEVIVNSTDKTLRPLVIRCAERKSGGVNFGENDGDYCVKIMNGTEVSETGINSYRIYTLP